MKMRINPNSSIRSGYSYEDLFVLKLSVDWLRDPERYSEIKIQFIPEDLGIKGFALDDVTATRKNGGVEYYQIKHLQNPDSDFWDLNKLISKGLTKWIKSFSALKESERFCSLITNGRLDDELCESFDDSLFNFEKIQKNDATFIQVLETEGYSELILKSFFDNFEFKFNQPSKTFLEEELRQVLYKDLKVTKAGVDSLLLYIAQQGSDKYPQIITLNEIRSRLSWDNPRPLNQNFVVPSDFQFFDKVIHQDIIDELQTLNGGVKVFIGKPGSGKSTYLSRLYSILKKKGCLVFRHHYHLNPKDSSFHERLNSERVIEGLKAEFKRQKNSVIESLGEQNTSHIQLKEFIDQISNYSRNSNVPFILIIDGLDHVIREGNSQRQLIDFLNEVLFPQKGFWLLIGTQEMATDCFPNAIHQYAPKSEWIEIKGLNRQSIKFIVNKSFPKQEESYGSHYEKIISKIQKLTAGNPLHLRYVLTEIKNRKMYLSTYDLDNISPYNGEIEKYYEAIWRRLPELCKTISFALTTLDFKLQEEQLYSLVSNLDIKPHKIVESFTQIRHLFRFDLRGISVFHNSFLVFILTQPELRMQQISLYQELEKWLKDEDQKELSWSELPKIQYYLGKPDLLLSINNDWITYHYLKGKSETIIENTLYIASKASFELKSFEKVIYFSTVLSLFRNREYNLGDTLATMWVTSFGMTTDSSLSFPHFSELTGYQVKEILIELFRKGKISEIPEDAINRINELFQTSDEDSNELAKYWVEVLCHAQHDINRVFNFIKQFRKEKRSSFLFGYYVKELLRVNSSEHKIYKIRSFKINFEEKQEIAKSLIFDDLLVKTPKYQDLIFKLLKGNDLLRNLYCKIFNLDYNSNLEILQFESFPKEVKYFSYEVHPISKKFEQNLICSFLNEEINYISIIPNDKNEDWLVQLYNAVLQIGEIIRLHYNSKNYLTIKSSLLPLIELTELNFSENREIYDYEREAIPKIINIALWLTTTVNRFNGAQHELNYDDLDFLNKWKFYNRKSLHEVIISKMVFVDENDFNFFIQNESKYSLEEVIPFNEKAQRLCELAIFALNNTDTNHAKILINEASKNILAYGNHKDMLLYQILESIEICVKSSSTKGNEFIKQIFPYVFNIEKLTDGDETSHFMGKLCGLLASVDSQLLYNQYFYNIEKRAYYDIENCFDDILYSFDYKDPVAEAIAGTALEPHFSTLQKVSKEKPDAIPVCSELQRRFNYDSSTEVNKEEKAIQIDEKLGAIFPSKIREHIENEIGYKIRFVDYSISSLLLDWFRSRLHKKLNTEESIIEIKIIINNDYSKVSSELLDEIYPFAYEFDKEFAYQCISWAHSNGGGWSMFSHNIEESQIRWKKVKTGFSERINDFYFKTVANVGLRYGTDKDYTIPIPNSTQFFVDTENLYEAERITQYYLDILPHIFPNVELKVPDYFSKPLKITNFDILISRLSWISPIVRGLAGEKIANLLRFDKIGEYHSVFLKYLFEEKLESRVCEGLLVIIKSLAESDSFTYTHITQSVLDNLLAVRCMATDLLMMKISSKLNLNLRFAEPLILAISSGKTKLTEEKFKHLVGRNLPLIYLDNIEFLQSEANDGFVVWNVWCKMYENECDFRSLKYNRNSDEDFKNSQHNYMRGRCTIFADILKSTFFRIIDALYQFDLIDYRDIWKLTIKNLPVDYSLWGVAIVNKPDWLPKLSINSSFEIENLKEVYSNLFRSENEYIPLYFSYSSPIKQNPDDRKSNFYELETTLFACNEDFIDISSEEEIHTRLWDVGFWYNPIPTPYQFGILDCELEFNESKHVSSELVPLVAPLVNQTNNMWNYFRVKNNIFLLSKTLSKDLLFDISSSQIIYKNSDGIIAFFGDFLEDFKDTAPFGEPIGYGSYLMVKKSYLENFMEFYNKKVGVLVKYNLIKKKNLGREDRYEENESFEKFLLNI
ncbi:NACHT domain-containing protein [Kaistella daneshvariae]|uniref:NACHT domain-containing protein n=1 Tax=Kaistella daneshvariae TaxID=2487074 RepID=A0ABM7C918_9FLAO|nr:ATP-binding protein [Kaistella daneshvariae]AZI67476.1 NACHT domain-containing protein [Kaistella daneshvariae]